VFKTIPAPSDQESLKLVFAYIKFGKLETDYAKVAKYMGLPTASASYESQLQTLEIATTDVFTVLQGSRL
jgi:hypothetical protein